MLLSGTCACGEEGGGSETLRILKGSVLPEPYQCQAASPAEAVQLACAEDVRAA